MSLFKGLLYDTVAGIPQGMRHKMQNVRLFTPTLEMMTYHLCYIQFIRNKPVSPVEWENTGPKYREAEITGTHFRACLLQKESRLDY